MPRTVLTAHGEIAVDRLLAHAREARSSLQTLEYLLVDSPYRDPECFELLRATMASAAEALSYAGAVIGHLQELALTDRQHLTGPPMPTCPECASSEGNAPALASHGGAGSNPRNEV